VAVDAAAAQRALPAGGGGLGADLVGRPCERGSLEGDPLLCAEQVHVVHLHGDEAGCVVHGVLLDLFDGPIVRPKAPVVPREMCVFRG
jgi:hypothetical protein